MIMSLNAIRATALLALVLSLGAVGAAPNRTVEPKPAAAERFAPLDNAAAGCGVAASAADGGPLAGSELLAARNNTPMCNYLQKCCAGNTDNAAKCCAGLAKNGC